MIRRLRGGHLAAAAGLMFLAAAPAALAQDGQELLAANCGGCHSADQTGALSRISGERKTPEGWLMTIVRMRLFHGAPVDPADQAELVRYLSETQGLAPSETADHRYILERAPNHQEVVEAPLAEMCARCHSGARVALQRRTPEEWNLLVDFHVGQWPTLEYQALARDREWLTLAREEVVPYLAETYPFEADAWSAWLEANKPEATGDWVFTTRLPELGEAYGTLTVSGDAQPFEVSGTLVTAGGEEMAVSGKLNVYTGYEWRANLTIGGTSYREVAAISEDGAALSGRLFLAAEDSLGGAFQAVKAGGGPAIAGVVPSTMKAGATGTVQIVGAGLSEVALSGPVDVSGGEPNAFGVALNLAPEADTNGVVAIAAGDVELSDGFAVYSQVDSLKVEPDYAIARVGGDDSSTPEVKALFEAIGYWNGPDGEAGTDDDVRIGAVPATWSVEPWDQIADEMEDVKFAGKMDADLGIFTPAGAGPNEARPFSTNNAGDLKVLAESGEATGEGHLIVTVQRWNDPPIR